MKKKIASLLLVSMTLFTSCKKEEVCTEGYSGTDCETQITPNVIKIKSVKIVTFPQYDDGADWDLLTNTQPDVYFRLMKGSNILFEQADYYENAIVTNNHTYESNITINDITTEYALLLYDYDNGSDDFMGGVNFYLYDSKNDFPETLLIDAGGEVSFELSLTYEW
jgi:hypothetical protein